MSAIAAGLNVKESARLREKDDMFIGNGEIKSLDFHPIPHDANYELDLHRPYIDDIELRLPDGEKMVRVEEVFDCWFESGSMPYAEAHYPFEKDSSFKPARGLFSNILGKGRGYPADFIAEGLDQTRGWFYSMLVLGTGLFGRAPYKNVVVNGIVLAEDGQKMAKSKNNFPDLLPVVNKYGADAMRYYLLSSPLVRAQEFCFSEKGVDEVVKKHIGRLLNVVSFYQLYAEEVSSDKLQVVNQNILDKWIISRLNQLNREVTMGLERYELDKATRPFADFIDDLSTWYLRRSRDRFKATSAKATAADGDDEADKVAALATTRFVLLELSKLLAPFMPFVAEEIYLKLKGGLESVHLEEWPVAGEIDGNLLENMKMTRTIASLGLEARSKAKINVRQPLSKLQVASDKFQVSDSALLDLIKEEVNVKEVAFVQGDTLDTVAKVELDTNITPELKEEGAFRELIRAVQDARKEKGLNISDRAKLTVSTEGPALDFVKKSEAVIKKSTGLESISYDSLSEVNRISIGDYSIGIKLS